MREKILRVGGRSFYMPIIEFDERKFDNGRR